MPGVIRLGLGLGLGHRPGARAQAWACRPGARHLHGQEAFMNPYAGARQLHIHIPIPGARHLHEIGLIGYHIPAGLHIVGGMVMHVGLGLR